MNTFQPTLPDDVLGALRQAEASLFTGSVGIAGDSLTGTLYLDEGRIYWASIPGEPDLPDIVSRLPVNSIMLARIRWNMTNGLTLAGALEKLDDVDHVAIRRAVLDAADERVRRLLEVDKGHTQMTPDVVAPVGVLVTWPLPPSPAPVGYATGEVGVAPAGPISLLEEVNGPVQLDAVEWRIVAAFAAPQPVDALAARTGLMPSEVMAVVERLRMRRLAAVPLPPSPPAPPPQPAPAPSPAPPPSPQVPPPSPPRATMPAPPPPPSGPARPVEGAGAGDRRSNALRRLISAVRGI